MNIFSLGSSIYIKEQTKKNAIKTQWPKPSHRREKGRPKKGQKTCSLQEPKKGESQSFSWYEAISPLALLMSLACKL
jgi:hypothetical protein